MTSLIPKELTKERW